MCSVLTAERSVPWFCWGKGTVQWLTVGDWPELHPRYEPGHLWKWSQSVHTAQPFPGEKKLPPSKDIMSGCCLLEETLSVCAIYGNKMKMCRKLLNFIIALFQCREDVLAEDTTGMCMSLPRRHDFVCPCVRKHIWDKQWLFMTDTGLLVSRKK